MWFKNPVTSETVGCMFPIIAINVCIMLIQFDNTLQTTVYYAQITTYFVLYIHSLLVQCLFVSSFSLFSSLM